ncbi:hypothetical protein QL285_087888 [Trifolium repens]|jgi:hypothetical protein|nr:hypothetical protein QL285_087888 [Trifolium repens]
MLYTEKKRHRFQIFLASYGDTNLMHEKLFSVIEASPSQIQTPLLQWSLCPPSLVVSGQHDLIREIPDASFSSPRIEGCRSTSTSSFVTLFFQFHLILRSS